MGGLPHYLFKKTGKMGRILEANLVVYLTNGFTAIEHPFFGQANHRILNIFLR